MIETSHIERKRRGSMDDVVPEVTLETSMGPVRVEVIRNTLFLIFFFCYLILEAMRKIM